MVAVLLSETFPKARKMHECMAADWINNSDMSIGELTFSEAKAIVKAHRNGFKIQIGEQYVRQNNVYEGRVYTFTAIPALHDICVKYDLYEL